MKASEKAQVTIRNLDPEVVQRLKALAAMNGRSLESELRVLLSRWSGEAERVGEEAAVYRVEQRVAREMPKEQVFPPPRKVRFPPITPIKLKGKLVSEQLIEDRR